MTRSALEMGIALCVLSLAFHTASVAAGSLDPPAGPAGTMVTLDTLAQSLASVEAAAHGVQDQRTVITGLPFVIDTRGSYRLASDLLATPGSPGIVISANDVDIDLAGHRLLGVGGGTDGFVSSTVTAEQSGVTIRGGTIAGWGGDAIALGSMANVALRDLRIMNNWGIGATLGRAGIVSECHIEGNGVAGISAGASCRIQDSVVMRNVGTGIAASLESIISQCVVTENGLGSDGQGAGVGGGGIILGGRSLIERCVVADNRGDPAAVIFGFGILSLGDCVIRDCVIRDNENFGISASGRITDNLVCDNRGLGGITTGDGVVSGNTCRNNSGFGIRTTNARVIDNTCTGNDGEGIISGGRSFIEGNLCTFNSVGIRASTGDNLVVRNACFSNPTNDYVQGDGTALPVNPGAGFTNTQVAHPWANFEN